jgi:adenylosuccinate synthase
VSERAHLVLPYHKLVDGESASSRAIGTTGRGIGPAYEDKIARRGVRVLDLRHPERLRDVVVKGAENAQARLARYGSDTTIDVDAVIEQLERLGQRLLPLADDVSLTVHRAVKANAAVLLEGAQGSLLDIDHGTYPYVTSSNTTAGGASIGVGIGPSEIDRVLGVVKAYTTRVGNGPLPTERDEPLKSGIQELGNELRRLGNEYGATTGRPRRCGWFDALVVKYATRVNGLSDLAVTKLDVLDTFNRLAICTGYEIDGELHDDFPSDLLALEKVVPKYEWFEGWKRSTADARTLADLPSEARRYLDRIESLVEAPITYVSVGTRRDQIIGL